MITVPLRKDSQTPPQYKPSLEQALGGCNNRVFGSCLVKLVPVK